MSVKAHMKVYIPESFITGSYWEQLKCSSADKRVSKVWSIRTVAHYSGMERGKWQVSSTTWVHGKCISLSESGQTQKTKYYVIPFM